MSEAPLPDWYDDLDGFETACWRMMVRGAADRRSGFHTPTVASVGDDGAPNARVVVLRGCDEAGRSLRFHTDARAAKIGELHGRPACVVFYDKGQKLQVRAYGGAIVHAAEPDGIGTIAWNATRPFSRACYRTIPAPGSAIPRGDAYDIPDADDAERGRESFRAVTVAVDRIEALYLAATGHRRATFSDKRKSWLVP